MNRCPIELWEIIFSHTCTDSGDTGCSPPLTSSSFHTSRRIRYPFVALKGIPATLKISQRLSEQPQTADDQICISHLYMSNSRLYDSCH